MSSFFESSNTNSSSDHIFSTSSPRISIPALPSIPSQSSRGESSSSSNSPGAYYSLFSTHTLSKNASGNSPPHSNSYHAYGNPHARIQPDQHLTHDLSLQMQSLQMGTNLPVRSMDPLENVLGIFPCVRLRGFPYDTHIEDILMFFQGLGVILDVLLPTNQYGQGTGEAFVLFSNPMDFQMALQRNRQVVRHEVVVEVFPVTRNEYHSVISSTYISMENIGESQGIRSHLHTQANTWATGGQMTQNVASQPSMRNHHTQGTIPDGFKLAGDSGTQNTGTYKGSRPARGGDTRNKGGSGRGSRGGGIQVGEHTGYLRMRGLPFTSSKKEIHNFFSDYNPIEDSICLTFRSDGRATGEGYIVFSEPDDAKKAMTLHRSTMGSRYIELFISNKEEHARAQSREPSR